jgi:hypothetical protein
MTTRCGTSLELATLLTAERRFRRGVTLASGSASMRQYARTLASPLPPETHDVGEGAQEVDGAPARRERSHCGGRACHAPEDDTRRAGRALRCSAPTPESLR